MEDVRLNGLKLRSPLTQQAGFISLPIVFLSMAIASMTMVYYEKLSESKQWVALQAPMVNQQGLWSEFITKVLVDFNRDLAVLSMCNGFCSLSPLTNVFHVNQNVSIHWRAEYFAFINQTGSRILSYRVCAKMFQSRKTAKTVNYKGAIHCWWLRDETVSFRLMSHIQFEE
jgi:hypothetical protein